MKSIEEIQQKVDTTDHVKLAETLAEIKHYQKMLENVGKEVQQKLMDASPMMEYETSYGTLSLSSRSVVTIKNKQKLLDMIGIDEFVKVSKPSASEIRKSHGEKFIKEMKDKKMATESVTEYFRLIATK